MTRYQRQIAVEQLGIGGQKRLLAAHVAIVGLGGLGCPLSLYLAGAGVGNIRLIDGDQVSLTNLHRQVLYREHDVGSDKATVVAKCLSELNKEICLFSHAENITPDNIDVLLSEVDVIVDATDNFALSYLLSDYARAHQTPLVSASVMQTQGYVGVYAFSTAANNTCPSLRAVFPNPPEAGQDCNRAGVIGTAAGMLGMLQAQEVIKVILGDKNQLAGRLLNLDCWTYRQSIMDFTSAPEPQNIVQILSKAQLAADDWVIDVRSPDEVSRAPKTCNETMPLPNLNLSNLPKDKRLVFTCASGQRALTAAEQAQNQGHQNVAVWL